MDRCTLGSRQHLFQSTLLRRPNARAAWARTLGTLATRGFGREIFWLGRNAALPNVDQRTLSSRVHAWLLSTRIVLPEDVPATAVGSQSDPHRISGNCYRNARLPLEKHLSAGVHPLVCLGCRRDGGNPGSEKMILRCWRRVSVNRNYLSWLEPFFYIA